MGWRLIDRPKTQRATKKLAKIYAEMEPAPNDRPLSERRLQVYQKLLAEGQFRPVTWASALCEETGDLYRVNGKHTSIMLSGLEEMPEFFITIEEYECDTLEDVAKLYATFDSAMQSRTARDIYMSFAATVSELKNVPIKAIQSAVTGIAMHKMGLEAYSRAQPVERAEHLLDHPEFVIWLAELMQGGHSYSETGSRSKQRCAHLLRQPVVAAMFATWSKAKQQASEFWSTVRDETGVSPTTPDRKLARFLVTTSMTRGGSGTYRGKLKAAGTREIYVKCLHAWNAWRKGESTNLNYYAEAKIPSIQ